MLLFVDVVVAAFAAFAAVVAVVAVAVVAVAVQQLLLLSTVVPVSTFEG